MPNIYNSILFKSPPNIGIGNLKTNDINYDLAIRDTYKQPNSFGMYFYSLGPEIFLDSKSRDAIFDANLTVVNFNAFNNDDYKEDIPIVKWISKNIDSIEKNYEIITQLKEIYVLFGIFKYIKHYNIPINFNINTNIIPKRNTFISWKPITNTVDSTPIGGVNIKDFIYSPLNKYDVGLLEFLQTILPNIDFFSDFKYIKNIEYEEEENQKWTFYANSELIVEVIQNIGSNDKLFICVVKIKDLGGYNYLSRYDIPTLLVFSEAKHNVIKIQKNKVIVSEQQCKSRHITSKVIRAR